MDHVGSLLLGLGNGAVFAALALALVLTYRSSGVINFATGAIAMFSAYTYASLRKGEMLLFLPGLPKSVDLGTTMGFAPAAAIALVLDGRCWGRCSTSWCSGRCATPRRSPGRWRPSAS